MWGTHCREFIIWGLEDLPLSCFDDAKSSLFLTVIHNQNSFSKLDLTPQDISKTRDTHPKGATQALNMLFTTSGSRGPRGTGLLCPPKIFSKKHAVLRQFSRENPYFEQIWGSGSPSGVKTPLGPPDQNPGSALIHPPFESSIGFPVMHISCSWPHSGSKFVFRFGVSHKREWCCQKTDLGQSALGDTGNNENERNSWFLFCWENWVKEIVCTTKAWI